MLAQRDRPGYREPRKTRAGAYSFGPAEELQHDTSPHKVLLDGKPVTAQSAGLVLAYSRRIFIRYYPYFTRFEAKVFLAEGIAFMDERYGRKSTIITTNLDYPQWYALFDRKPLVDALLDRLQHRCVTIRISGPSLRAPSQDESQESPNTSSKKQNSKSKPAEK